jgi:hypothetical protein
MSLLTVIHNMDYFTKEILIKFKIDLDVIKSNQIAFL